MYAIYGNDEIFHRCEIINIISAKKLCNCLGIGDLSGKKFDLFEKTRIGECNKYAEKSKIYVCGKKILDG